MNLAESISKKVEEYKTELLMVLSHLISIDSVRGEAEEGKPFGKKPFMALHYLLHLGKEMGFSVENCDGYAGTISYGKGKEYVGVAVHADVVPAGDGWNTEPFLLTKQGDTLYGRGVSDDKGPAVCVLYAMRILKELGVTGDRELRLIVGSGEETGMEDLAYYFKNHSYPAIGFSPDGDYPMVNRESGILNLKENFAADDSNVLSFHGGDVYNAVPSSASCAVKKTEDITEQELCKKAAVYSTDKGKITYQISRDSISFFSTGIAFHASQAEHGFNAVCNLICFLKDVYGDKIGKSLCKIAEKIGMETNGHTLGVSVSDELSKALTLNVGKLHIENESGEMGIDIRYPVTADGDKIIKTITDELTCMSVKIEEHLKPLYVPEDSELIRKLKQVYETATHKDGSPIAMAGGTYARAIGGNVVAFGAAFGDGVEGNIHMPNEFVKEKALWENVKICALAMAALLNK